MAYRVRFYMDMNAREAMHVIELRTAPQGHPAYRRVCQQMHTLIAEQAGHRAIAAAMQFADHSEVELERLNAERALEARRARTGGAAPVTPTVFCIVSRSASATVTRSVTSTMPSISPISSRRASSTGGRSAS